MGLDSPVEGHISRPGYVLRFPTDTSMEGTRTDRRTHRPWDGDLRGELGVGLISRRWREAPFLFVLITRSLVWLAIIVVGISVPLLTVAHRRKHGIWSRLGLLGDSLLGSWSS